MPMPWAAMPVERVRGQVFLWTGGAERSLAMVLAAHTSKQCIHLCRSINIFKQP